MVPRRLLQRVRDGRRRPWLEEGVNSNAYYFVDVVAEEGPAPVWFNADRDSRNASLDDQWLVLAKYVPALSGAVGGKSVGSIGNNINMDVDSERVGVPRPNGWGRPAVDDKTDWHHSDMKDMAYFYVYKLYEQLIQKGNLK